MVDPAILAQAIEEYAAALEHHSRVLGVGFREVDQAFVHLMHVWQGEGAGEFSRGWQAATGGFEELRTALPALLKELRSRAAVLRGI